MRCLFNTVSLGVLFVISVQWTWAQKPYVHELGTYPGGSWFTTESIDDFGVVVGRGDVPPHGYTHTLAVPLFGPAAGQWMDLGALDGEQPKGFEYESFTQISDTGLVVGHSTAHDGYEHGVAWTRLGSILDLGTLAATGDPAYADYMSSFAMGTNKLGTLIAGMAQTADGRALPIVWTPVWKPGGLTVVWKIHVLDTTAELPYGQAWWVNDFGQVSGVCGNGLGVATGVVWVPRADGKGWQFTPLPPSPNPDYPNSNAYGINEKGEIAGVVMSGDFSTWLPRLWVPRNAKRTKYSQPIELALPKGGFTSCESVGLNEIGEIVGDCWNEDYSVDLSVHWTTTKPNVAEIVNFPGSWGYSWSVNNSRMAVVTYGDSTRCPADTYVSCGGVATLH